MTNNSARSQWDYPLAASGLFCIIHRTDGFYFSYGKPFVLAMSAMYVV